MTYIDIKKEYLGITNDNLEEYKHLWNNTKAEEVLKHTFKCSIEIYAYDKHMYDSAWEDDCPVGDLHFISKNNKIYDYNFNEIPIKDFKKKYGILKRDIMKLVTNKVKEIDVPTLSDNDTGYSFIKFDNDDLGYYEVSMKEELI